MSLAPKLSISTLAFIVGLGASPAMAQTVTGTQANTNVTANSSADADSLNSAAIDRIVDRDLGQETRIENGLKSGQLTDSEAARLQRGESRIDGLESNALKSGDVSVSEAAKIRDAQRLENERINRLSNNNVTGTPNMNDPMIGDVQRNINQQRRIDKGLDNGSITNAELSSLENGQAKLDNAEAKAGRNGSISASEQARIQAEAREEGRDIRQDKTNTTVVGDGMSTVRHDRDHDGDHGRSEAKEEGRDIRQDKTNTTVVGDGTSTASTVSHDRNHDGDGDRFRRVSFDSNNINDHDRDDMNKQHDHDRVGNNDQDHDGDRDTHRARFDHDRNSMNDHDNDRDRHDIFQKDQADINGDNGTMGQAGTNSPQVTSSNPNNMVEPQPGFIQTNAPNGGTAPNSPTTSPITAGQGSAASDTTASASGASPSSARTTGVTSSTSSSMGASASPSVTSSPHVTATPHVTAAPHVSHSVVAHHK